MRLADHNGPGSVLLGDEGCTCPINSVNSSGCPPLPKDSEKEKESGDSRPAQGDKGRAPQKLQRIPGEADRRLRDTEGDGCTLLFNAMLHFCH